MNTAEKIFEISRLEGLANAADRRARTSKNAVTINEAYMLADSYREQADELRKDLV